MAICWTNAKEEEALERYKLITGNIVLFPKFQVHGKNSLEMIGLQLSSDGLVDKCSGLNSRGVLEIKCPFFKGEMCRASPWKKIPLYCVPQAQAYLLWIDTRAEAHIERWQVSCARLIIKFCDITIQKTAI
ncbi:hypothetical protein NC651_019619 [Populus alba x Populus x berolinensis]|nr:hypothetical protein NC651_019619 [Populus alba x Populus x berolinensis]